MSTRLRALLVEDNPYDAELLVRRLQHEGFEVTWQRVDNELDFRRALSAPLDLVLCDYSLPRFSGLEALGILREQRPDLPLVLVSGTIGEEVAVDAMQHGAVDYLLKDRLERLGTAVRRALLQGQLQREHQRAQAALELSERRFRQLTEHIEEVFWIKDAATQKLLYVSPAFEHIWGRPAAESDALGQWPVAVHPEDSHRLQSTGQDDAAAATEDTDREYRIVRPDGSVRVIHERAFAAHGADGQLEHIVGVASDVTRARQLEEQYRHAQKMEAIGRLAGGIAHDFNNLLSVIMSGSALLLADAQLPVHVTTGLEEIRLASERAAALTRQLLVFSRRETFQSLDLNLNELVVSISKLLARVLGEDITLSLELAPFVLPLRADRSMLEQVLMNLAVNARDAMPRGGELHIETALVPRDDAPASLVAQSPAASFALLRVRDTGCGIPQELRERVFEPFFTTKPEGKGTGLGLATLSTIVQRHGGTVELSSAPGKGATFSVYLPCVKQRPPRAEHPHQAVARSGSGSGETILVVEDDQALRAITVRALTRAGYHVLCAESGPRALEVWKVQRESIRMLLTDLVMPGGIPGRELARMLSADMPTLRVVYTSGYSDDIAGRELGPHERFLAKPYTPERLADVVRACLSAAS